MALPRLLQSFDHHRRAGVKHGVEERFELLAQMSRALGHHEQAVWCWGVVEHLEQDIGNVLLAALGPQPGQALRTLESEAPAVIFMAARAACRCETLDEALPAVQSSVEVRGLRSMRCGGCRSAMHVPCS